MYRDTLPTKFVNMPVRELLARELLARNYLPVGWPSHWPFFWTWNDRCQEMVWTDTLYYVLYWTDWLYYVLYWTGSLYYDVYWTAWPWYLPCVASVH